MDRKTHWDRVYRNSAPNHVSWYQAEPEPSLRLIRGAVPDTTAAIIDVGAGASMLADGLISAGYRRLAVLDFSGLALATARIRLGAAGRSVNWIEADALDAPLRAGQFDFWHDRAVFHFLTDAADRQRYVEQVRRVVRPGGQLLIATFAPDGPARCSGLDVARYSPEGLQAEFGPGFQLRSSTRAEHQTPGGQTQAFLYCLYRVEED